MKEKQLILLMWVCVPVCVCVCVCVCERERERERERDHMPASHLGHNNLIIQGTMFCIEKVCCKIAVSAWLSKVVAACRRCLTATLS
jgi:hypothetical protein